MQKKKKHFFISNKIYLIKWTFEPYKFWYCLDV